MILAMTSIPIPLSWQGRDDHMARRSTTMAMATCLTLCALSSAHGQGPVRNREPTWSPTGRQIAFVTNRDGNVEIYSMSPDGSKQTNLTNHEARDAAASWSNDGSKIAFVSDRDGGNDVYVMNADGTRVGRVTFGVQPIFSQPSWSPDDSRLLYVAGPSHREADLYIIEMDGANRVQLTDSPGLDGNASWSHDGSQIAFVSTRDENVDMYIISSDGTGLRRFATHPAEDLGPRWSPDDAQIVFFSRRTGDFEVFVIRADGSVPVQLTNTPGLDGSPSWSPNGTRIAFMSSRDGGGEEIYVMNADGSVQTRLTRTERRE